MRVGSITAIAAVDQVAADSSSTGGVPADRRAFIPPAESTMPNDEFGKVVRLASRSLSIRLNMPNPMSAMHSAAATVTSMLGAANAAPLWAAFVSYPAYRTKSHSVMTYEQRLQDCFRYSMNGRAPPLGANRRLGCLFLLARDRRPCRFPFTGTRIFEDRNAIEAAGLRTR
jgi:thiosulfate dehydrogenase